ncbi:MAG: lipoprotein [Pseudomonadota bacterium]
MRAVTLMLLLISLLAACGHKGPLYLPEQQPTADQQKKQ